MVSFICDGCQDVKTKPKALAHFAACRACATMSCIDCGVTFSARTIRAHTSCVTEAAKYGPRTSAAVAADTQTRCATCALALNGAVHALQHYESKKHKKMLRAAKSTTPPRPRPPAVEAAAPPATPPVEAVVAGAADAAGAAGAAVADVGKSGKVRKKLLRRSMRDAICKADSRQLSVKKLTAAVKRALGDSAPPNIRELVDARCDRAPFQKSGSQAVTLR